MCAQFPPDRNTAIRLRRLLPLDAAAVIAGCAAMKSEGCAMCVLYLRATAQGDRAITATMDRYTMDTLSFAPS